jgi:hypothetical protein
MAIVINPTGINAALESVFKNVSRTYTLYLRGLSEVVLDSEVVTFNTASGGSIDLTSAVIFSVASGSQVVSVQLKDELNAIYFTETLSPQPTYNDNGTYTINNITITYGV